MPLASTSPSRSVATAYGLPGMRRFAQIAASATLVETGERDRRIARERPHRRVERRANRGRLGDEHGECELGPIAHREAIGLREALAQRRPLTGDLERRRRTEPQPQHPDLAGEREHRDGEPGAGEQGDRQPEAEPFVGARASAREASGSAANAAASSTLRATPRQPTVERAPKHAQGAPARPRMIAADHRRREHGHQRRRAEFGDGRRRRTRPRRGRARRRSGPPRSTHCAAGSLNPKLDSALRLDCGLASFATLAAASTPPEGQSRNDAHHARVADSDHPLDRQLRPLGDRGGRP